MQVRLPFVLRRLAPNLALDPSAIPDFRTSVYFADTPTSGEDFLRLEADSGLGLLREVLASPKASQGVIMDGFPRTVAQAEAVDTLLAERKLALEVTPAARGLLAELGTTASARRSPSTPSSSRPTC